jgi:hypothetical protein
MRKFRRSLRGRIGRRLSVVRDSARHLTDNGQPITDNQDATPPSARRRPPARPLRRDGDGGSGASCARLRSLPPPAAEGEAVVALAAGVAAAVDAAVVAAGPDLPAEATPRLIRRVRGGDVCAARTAGPATAFPVAAGAGVAAAAVAASMGTVAVVAAVSAGIAAPEAVRRAGDRAGVAAGRRVSGVPHPARAHRGARFSPSAARNHGSCGPCSGGIAVPGGRE